MLYPLLMAPAYRHGRETPWGGDLLRDIFMKDAPTQTGESLEVSALPGLESVVRNGVHAGKSFTRMIELWGRDLTGLDEGERFPLLLKLIDAQETLSVQVHPGDEYALAHDNKLGKTEAWVVLCCEEGAELCYGVDLKDEDLAAVTAKGDSAIEGVLRHVRVRPGDVYYIPSGLIHAIGAGIQLYEIQQSSDATYRFYDWGRVDKDGNARELHTQKAVDVARPELHPEKLRGVTALCRGGSRTYYISNRYFELCRLNVSGSMPVDDGRFLFLTPLAPCTIRYGEESMEVAPFDTVVIPAGLRDVRVESEDCKILMSSLPRREELRAELTYRAENVAGLLDE